MITIGADPEFFLQKDGDFVSAHGLIPGTKKNPLPVEKGAVQVDGIALEFNIDPASSYEEFQGNLDQVLGALLKMVPDFQPLQEVSVVLSEDVKKTIPKEALIIGCNSDIDAYEEEENPTPDQDNPVRAAGGHIHIGGIFTAGDTKITQWRTAMRLSRLMDKYVGVYSLLWDDDTFRRQIYGKAGACRLKPYGLEYRCLSNAWLFKRPITEFVFNGTMEAVEALLRGEDVESHLYREIINSADVDNEFFRNNEIAKHLKEVA